MKKVKKVSCLLAACCLLLAGCGKKEQFAYDEEYRFSEVTFSYSDKVKIADLAKFIPAGMTMYSVKEFEKYIIENLDTYSFVKTVNGQQEIVYLKNELEWIRFSSEDQTAILLYQSRTYTTMAYPQTGFTDKRFVVGMPLGAKMFYYKDGYVYYKISLTDGFDVNYIFDNE